VSRLARLPGGRLLRIARLPRIPRLPRITRLPGLPRVLGLALRSALPLVAGLGLLLLLTVFSGARGWLRALRFGRGAHVGNGRTRRRALSMDSERGTGGRRR
jgi:hypothetical protein